MSPQLARRVTSEGRLAKVLRLSVAVQGRVTAGHRFIVYGACALGAFASGALGSIIGVRAALAVFAIGIIVSPLLAVW